MTEQLKIAIENLYDVLKKYQGLSQLEGSPIYDDLESWNRELRSKKLRELTSADLSRFAGSVMLTWGDEDDLRAYLPRILELVSQYDEPYDIWYLYNRLEDAKWQDWAFNEQTAINNFTFEFWNNLLADESSKAENNFKDIFHAFANFHPNFSQLLEAWEKSETISSIKYLANYILEERNFLFDHNYINGLEKSTKNINEFKAWLISENVLKKLEIAFYSSQNEEISERISWVEQILSMEKRYSNLE
jgi:hypothetical protein